MVFDRLGCGGCFFRVSACFFVTLQLHLHSYPSAHSFDLLPRPQAQTPSSSRLIPFSHALLPLPYHVLPSMNFQTQSKIDNKRTRKSLNHPHTTSSPFLPPLSFSPLPFPRPSSLVPPLLTHILFFTISRLFVFLNLNVLKGKEGGEGEEAEMVMQEGRIGESDRVIAGRGGKEEG